jgi:predicted dehydrogenase
LRYHNGVLGVFDCGFCQQFRVEAEIIGTDGALIVERPYPISPASRIRLEQGFEEKEMGVPEMDGYQCEVEALTAAILDGAPLPVPLESSRANVDILTTLYRSAQLGRPQPVAVL